MKKMFITFEGIEGCGKSTQAKLLKKYLIEKGHKVLLTREPGGPQISEKIRELLLDPFNKEMLPETEMLLYMASRSQHTGEWIIPALQKGKFVISDRYYDSTIAYQGAARKIDLNIINTITKYATYGLVPDITFLIDLPAEVGLSRISPDKADRLEQESLEFHQRVRKGFLNFAENNKNRYVIIDGKDNIEDIQKNIIKKMSILEDSNEDF
ncbi:MAG: dTMP kinase [Candidatus Cloacimonetes bacterium]|nr:dTMP kinase [Candidatus Cloacimonadota bacterium]